MLFVVKKNNNYQAHKSKDSNTLSLQNTTIENKLPKYCNETKYVLVSKNT